MNPLTLAVQGLPPAKGDAKSLLSPGHRYSDRVVNLLRAAQEQSAAADTPHFGEASLGMELTLTSPTHPPSDATNYLGGVADVLEDKKLRGASTNLGNLIDVALYANDRQIQDVRYRWVEGDEVGYTVRFWELTEPEAP
jgi:hypothetical protein